MDNQPDQPHTDIELSLLEELSDDIDCDQLVEELSIPILTVRAETA